MSQDDILVGSVGTNYFVPTWDRDLPTPVNFDPTLATVKQLRFKMPGCAALLVRTATAIQHTIEGASVWGLEYIVLAADVVAYVSPTVGGFHQSAGLVSIEGYLEFSAGAQKWPSSTVTTDQQGRTLRVAARLSA